MDIISSWTSTLSMGSGVLLRRRLAADGISKTLNMSINIPDRKQNPHKLFRVGNGGQIATRLDLDEASTDHPIVIKRVCLHTAVANTMALEKANITNGYVFGPGGMVELDSDGNPNGIFREQASKIYDNLIPDPFLVPATREKCMRKGLALASSLGVTMMHTYAAAIWHYDEDFADYEARSNRGELPVRMFVCLDYMFDPEHLTAEQRSDPYRAARMGGFKRVSSVTDILVPVMACLYVVGALVIIFANVGELPAVFGMIFKDAFTGRAAVGGFAGATIMAAIRWGAARGVYSNEAGVGSTIAGHCTADTDHPIRQAQFGIFEVFMDTIVICTITSLAVLCSGVWTQEGLSSGQLALAAFQSVFGNFGAIFVAVTVFLFVFSTIISAGFFGQIQAEILFGRKFSKVWVYIYPLFICIACAFSNVTTMYMILDGFLAVVVILNMIGLVFMCKQVKDLQTEYYNTPGMYYLADRAAKESKKAAK